MKRVFRKMVGAFLMLAGIAACIYFTGNWHWLSGGPLYSDLFLIPALTGIGCFLAGAKMYYGRCIWEKVSLDGQLQGESQHRISALRRRE